LDQNIQQPWQGRTTLVLALSAVSVGLGNILRLPYAIGEQGGGAFLLVYVAATLIIALPVLIAELTVGSLGRNSPMGSIQWVASLGHRDTRWRWLGFVQAMLALTVASLLLLAMTPTAESALYVSDGSWAAASATEIIERLSGIDTADHLRVMAVLVAATGLAVLPGPQVILTLVGWVLLPVMLFMVYTVLNFAMAEGDLQAANEWLFSFHLDQLTRQGVLAAGLAAVTTLAAGFGIGIVFGSRSPSGLPLVRSMMAVALIDMTIMLSIGIAIVAILAAVDTKMTQGVALVAVAIPHAFVNLPAGEVYGSLLLVGLLLATGAAMIALFEPAVAIISRDLDVPRLVAVMIVAAAVWLMAALWLTQPSLASLVDGYLIPLFAPALIAVIAIFVGWLVPRPILRGEQFKERPWLFSLWMMTLRWLTPAACLMLLIDQAQLMPI